MLTFNLFRHPMLLKPRTQRSWALHLSFRVWVLLFLTVLHSSAAHAQSSAAPLSSSVPLTALADDIAQAQQLDAEWVRTQLQSAKTIPAVSQWILPPAQASSKNWQAYRARFVEPVRIRAGVKFWRQHKATLLRAEQRYGVPAHILVGVLGVETLYGQHMGTFRVLDALYTLTVNFPQVHPKAAARQAFFQSELGQFLKLAQEQGELPTRYLGSYAGAMGLPQFMPSSWRRYAVDFDGDGRVDLRGSVVDAIGSVAHYLSAHGWCSQVPTHYPARFKGDAVDWPTLLAPDILPSFSVSELTNLGLVIEGELQKHDPAMGKLALVELLNGGAAPSHVVGTENFYVITRYNWSSYYALAVIDLGLAVEAAVGIRSGAAASQHKSAQASTPTANSRCKQAS